MKRKRSFKGPEFAVEVERKGDAVTVGTMAGAGRGRSLCRSLENPRFGHRRGREHRRPGRGREIASERSTARVFRSEPVPSKDFICPGEHSAALPWAALAKSLPQGQEQNRRPLLAFASGDKREEVVSWEPIVFFARPGTTPKFKNVAARYSDENRLSFTLPLETGRVEDGRVWPCPTFRCCRGSRLQLGSLSIDEKLARFREYWSHELNRNAEFIVPEKRVRDTYRTCLANNLHADRPRSEIGRAHAAPRRDRLRGRLGRRRQREHAGDGSHGLPQGSRNACSITSSPGRDRTSPRATSNRPKASSPATSISSG